MNTPQLASKEKAIKKKNSEFELLRFLFAFLIMSHHFGTWAGYEGLTIFKYGNIGVEFFFILSGLLMAKSAFKTVSKNAVDVNNIGTLTFQYLISKIKVFLPYLIIAILLPITTFILLDGLTATLLEDIVDQLPNYFLLMESGIWVDNRLIVGVTWYLSSMIIAMLILYPLLIYRFNLSKYVLFPLIFLFSIGYLVETDSILSTLGWTGFAVGGLLRGIGEIALGTCCFFIAESFKQYKITIATKIILPLIKIGCIITVLLFAADVFDSVHDYTMLIPISILCVIIQSEQGPRIPDGVKPCMYIGALSLPLFLFHGPFSALLTVFMRVDTAWFAMSTAIIFSMFVMAIVKICSAKGINIFNLLIKHDN